MSSLHTKTVIAFVLAFLAGVIGNLANHTPLGAALTNSLKIGLLAAAIVAVLAWGSEAARAKGYPGALGLLLVVILNVIGVIILWLLPNRNSNY